MLTINLSKIEIEQWKSEAAAISSVSQVLRKISAHYKINKFEVASLASEIFEEVFFWRRYASSLEVGYGECQRWF